MPLTYSQLNPQAAAASKAAPQPQAQPQQGAVSPIQITPPIGSQQSVHAPPPFDPATADHQVIKVAQAIRNIESGGKFDAVGDNGHSYGAYQWNNGNKPLEQGQTPVNWQNMAKQFLGSADAPMTPENQNFVAYSQIKHYKDQGLSPASIDALWNGGKADPMNPGQYLHISPQRAQKFNNELASVAQGQSTITPQINGGSTDSSEPSLGGFAGNVVKSGANLIGNIGEALLHPINTVQNIGGAAVGGLQELGGQQNAETAKWDNLKNYFAQRYGGISNVEHSLYTDPVGVLADLSTALGIGAGVAGAVGKAGKLGSIASAADAADAALSTGVRTMAGDTAIGNSFTRGATAVAGGLRTASEYTNPLTPVVAGVGALAGKLENPVTSFAAKAIGVQPNDLATAVKYGSTEDTRASLATEIESALQKRDAQFSESGTGYKNLYTQPNVTVDRGFLDDAIRKAANVKVIDGKVEANTLRTAGDIHESSDITKIQTLLDNWKPTFQQGNMSVELMHDFRQKLGGIAYNENGIRNAKLADVADKIYKNVNEKLRPQVKGMAEKDAEYSAIRKENKDLMKGIVTKDSNGVFSLNETATNKIANAGGVGKDKLLRRLENIIPGIGHRLDVMKAQEAIQKASGFQVGTYTHAGIETGAAYGVAKGALTGDIRLFAGSLATAIFTNPDVAIPLLKFFADHKDIAAAVTQKLHQLVTMPTILNRATQSSREGSQGQQQPQSTTPSSGSQSVQQQTSQQGNSSQNDITQTLGYREAEKLHGKEATDAYLAQNPQVVKDYLANQ